MQSDTVVGKHGRGGPLDISQPRAAQALSISPGPDAKPIARLGRIVSTVSAVDAHGDRIHAIGIARFMRGARLIRPSVHKQSGPARTARCAASSSLSAGCQSNR